jgi:hypothetical protein
VRDAIPRPIEPPPVARWAIAAIALAVCGTVALVAFSLTRPEPQGFTPTAAAEPFPGTDDGSLRLTVDASSPDAWRFVSLSHGAPVAAQDDWDLAFRRFHIMSNGGPGFSGTAAVADLGPVAFEAAAIPPDSAFRATEAARDSTNPAIDRWYRYGFTSHLLTPLDRTYVVRAAAGRHYALRVQSYYCPGARPGCLTIRYLALDPPDP